MVSTILAPTKRYSEVNDEELFIEDYDLSIYSRVHKHWMIRRWAIGCTAWRPRGLSSPERDEWIWCPLSGNLGL